MRGWRGHRWFRVEEWEGGGAHEEKKMKKKIENKLIGKTAWNRLTGLRYNHSH